MPIAPILGQKKLSVLANVIRRVHESSASIEEPPESLDGDVTFRLPRVVFESQFCSQTPHPGDILAQDIQKRLEKLPEISGAKVEVVFDPPWNQSMMSEAARLQLGFY